ncbi:uncharacterized protein LOC106865802 [Brachypodium distachyon]|uniref:Peptidase S26 domain-containing protein n=1 Tax=Brachypodium distachyon TaxID=15368 RepID=A0A0Q3NJ04_BRADI|nr:uncharacterized protein LOC106865802 [Brachypodium distachyon]KQK17446.1 hypothetical protein BRADI_1g34516v3 [Brachypodium distachyon]PNT75552.1 hypothetical protein BRADI_1g34516v3 [Brachypodium distachyon]PNT75553.1 hypothetical protein BRADI_1g34516v3 [Brachypodium distachyon]|eukprot:XP_014752104.1 uncharacterized protein LOC106865802 [Brachypodium distachyon]
MHAWAISCNLLYVKAATTFVASKRGSLFAATASLALRAWLELRRAQGVRRNADAGRTSPPTTVPSTTSLRLALRIPSLPSFHPKNPILAVAGLAERWRKCQIQWLDALPLARPPAPPLAPFLILLILLLVSTTLAEVTYLFRRPSVGDIVFFRVPRGHLCECTL